MNMSKHAATITDNIDLGRIIGQLMDHKGFILSITFAFAVAGILYAILSIPIYRGDALVQVERRSSVSPLGDLANVMGDPMGGFSESSTAAEVEILQSRMVLGQVVDRVELDTVVIPRELPFVGNFIQRRQIARPDFINHRVSLADWLPEQIAIPEALQSSSMPDALKGGLALPDFLGSSFEVPGFAHARSAVWGGETLRLGMLEVVDHLRGVPLILTAQEAGRFALALGGEEPRELGTGTVGQTVGFEDGAIQLRLAELQAAEGAQFTLVKRPRHSAIRHLGGRLQVNELGGRSTGAGTGMLRLTLTGPDREEIRRSLNAVTETFLTQNVERKSAEAEKSLAFLEEQAPELRSQLAAAEDSLNQYRVEQDSVDLSSEAQAAIQQFIELESRLNELEFQEAALAQRYTTSHPTYQSLLRQKQHLQQERAELNARVNDLPAAQQEVVRRTRDVEVTQAIYVNVLNKMQELEVARAGTVGNVRIIDSALVGDFPIEPRKPLIVVLATVLGGMLAVGIVLLRGLLNRGVEAPEQLENVGLPVYASVPLSDEQKKLIKRVKHRRDRKAREVFSDVLAHRAPADTTTEAVRGLRTSLHFAMLEAGNNRLMITGPSPGIGKSFIAVNLATVCAQSGQRVLVIDADMRKGQVHHAFGGASDGGLSELLSGKQQLEDVLRGSGIENLDYMSRGTAPPNPSELLMTASFSECLAQVSQRYDLVVIDTPPVLAVTDAVVVGAQCATSMMVARFQVNPPREMQMARRRLEAGGVVVKGAILNAMERKAAASYGYGYYQYAYR